mmetsp:Transcript_23295/g.66169  ORF Transcript_23295/g.66169 Transcript_23295/m.66169 type:complete len:914 (-) Transcript_23295:53-2794(-)|eukprot:CAMPEP_0202103256 /NCGR_PEP_ID=MMETSP0965-20130614/4783_1 /ASSEMBLY_ACC=CAM_ASM_000507 /TAXON_ID=4773 /ORGANISM="Schizochytrium aggregatum, Strain ATCC28209" /LENGTH=913 /DNA_ID=CAMNT_0048672051 /DNA_START=98 /DNA_END=2839 /DNA_ORIENTATION=+
MSRLDNDPSRWLRPRKYDIHFSSVDLDACTFAGSVKIAVQVEEGREPAPRIVLHSKLLKVNAASIICDGDVAHPVADLSLSQPDETVTLTVPADVELDKIVALQCDFQGELNDSLAGLYRSYYVDEAGQKRCMAVTQFEACDARRAFPCFDEPNLKASFELSVVAPADRTCVSNTPATFTKTDRTNGTKLWRFAETPVMSTYLLALLVGDLDSVSAYSERGVYTTVYTRPGCADQGLFALDVACRALDFYEKEYGIDYPLKKQDLAGLPDFAAGAMENWGLVTYREQRLLVDENTSEASKFMVARVVAHENAHMWFGNLVTMDYWTDLWLNEGFARFMEFNCVNHLFPAWRSWTVFVQDIQTMAMRLDSMKSTHPVRVEVKSPSQISEIFDAISYAKGASIIRMLEGYLGHGRFMAGVQLYLSTYEYGNAITDNLWASIEKANLDSIKPGSVQELMAAWTGKGGFPVILIDEDCNISVERFLNNPTTDAEREVAREEGKQWHIPLKLRAAGDAEVQQITLHSSESIAALSQQLQHLGAADRFVALNADMTGFFRVCYSETQWKRLLGAMTNRSDSAASIPARDPETMELSPEDRIGLVRDAFQCAASGYLPMSVPLEMAVALMTGPVEKDAPVLLEITRWLTALAGLYREEDFFADFCAKILVPCCAPVLEQLTWEVRQDAEEDYHVAALRAAVLRVMSKAPVDGGQVATPETASSVGMPERAAEMVRDHCSGGSVIAPDLRLAVFQLAAKSKVQTQENYKVMHARLQREDISAEERRDLLESVAAFGGHEDLLSEVVEYALSSVRVQDVPIFLAPLASSSDAAAGALWARLTSEFDAFWEKYSGVSFLWGRIIDSIVGAQRGADKIETIKAFFEGKEMGTATRSLQTALERVQERLDRLSRERDTVAAFIAK